MSPVTQYVFDGTKWQNEVHTSRSRPGKATTEGVGARDHLVLGEYKPGPTTAGLIKGYPLTQVNTPMTYSQVGTATKPYVIENKQFNDRVTVKGKYLAFKNCWFRGSPTDNIELVKAYDSTVGQTLYVDCLFQAQAPQWATAGFKGGYQVTLSRCEFRGVIDGVAYVNPHNNYTEDQGFKIYGCWFHDLALFSPDPGAWGGIYDNAGHVDLVQLRGGSNFHFKGNNFDGHLDPAVAQASTPSVDHAELDSNGRPTGKTIHVRGNPHYPKSTPQSPPSSTQLATMSVFMLSPKLGPLKDVTIEKNWIDGGIYSFNFANYTTDGTNIVIRDNVWGRSMYAGPTCTILAKQELKLTLTGNTFASDGSSANIRKRG